MIHDVVMDANFVAEKLHLQNNGEQRRWKVYNQTIFDSQCLRHRVRFCYLLRFLLGSESHTSRLIQKRLHRWSRWYSSNSSIIQSIVYKYFAHIFCRCQIRPLYCQLCITTPHIFLFKYFNYKNITNLLCFIYSL